MKNKCLGEKYKSLFAVLLAVFSILAVWYKTGIFFGTNDDRVITEMLAGTVVQTPDSHVKIINWLLAVVLCRLYSITTAIPWYGLCLILFHAVSWFAIHDSILSCCGNKPEIAAGIALGCGSFLINLYSTGLIQFTSTAALLAIAGYVSLCLRQDRTALRLFGFLELLSFLLRSDAMLMIQPLGSIVFLGLFWADGGFKREDRQRMLASWCALMVAVLAVGKLGNLLGYHGLQWRQYDQFNQARIEMFDFYGTPEYEDVKDILDRYGVSELEYEAYRAYVMLDGDISPDCAVELAAYAKENNGSKPGMITVLRQTFDARLYRDSLCGGGAMMLLWIILTIWAILSGQFRLILPLLGLGIARTGVWGYIIYKDRILPRVSYPLIFCESMLLLIIFVKSYERIRKDWKIIGMAICLSCAFLVQGYREGQSQYRYVRSENEGQAIYIEGLREIRNYCMQYPDRHFFLENGSFSFYKGSALETDIYQPGNGMYTGGWNANTPMLREYFQTYTGGSWDDVYLIVYDDGKPVETQAIYAVVVYFAEKSGKAPTLTDRIAASHGGAYLVWHF